MDRQLLEGKNVIIQGITGAHGSFHAAAMRANGTHVIAGTSPNKAGQFVDGIPVYETIEDIQKDFMIDTSVVFVPAAFAKAAIIEAINAKIPLIICITEGIPIHDMLDILKKAKQNNCTLIGPNCPGILIPGGNKLGIIPAQLGLPGSVGIVSRSGTLTYEVTAGLTARNTGQRYIIGIGGDRVHGIGFTECLALFEDDPSVTSIVLIGEIGGSSEHEAAAYIKQRVTKPVYAYVVGHHAPKDVQLGHAGAILSDSNESASAKTEALRRAGAKTFTSITELIKSVG
ncbi:MAG TPA: succinate--CoA ligase subunit alpha [Candidatus Saccharimonadales bacterium]|nr:succinate--CoA ligase subunit alpha [Candidatus Saccharimonadales bacterium]